jgi:hypothetical protein
MVEEQLFVEQSGPGGLPWHYLGVVPIESDVPGKHRSPHQVALLLVVARKR